MVLHEMNVKFIKLLRSDGLVFSRLVCSSKLGISLLRTKRKIVLGLES